MLRLLNVALTHPCDKHTRNIYKSDEHGKIHSDSLCSLTGAYTVCDVFTLKYPLPKEKKHFHAINIPLVMYLYAQLVQL